MTMHHRFRMITAFRSPLGGLIWVCKTNLFRIGEDQREIRLECYFFNQTLSNTSIISRILLSQQTIFSPNLLHGICWNCRSFHRSEGSQRILQDSLKSYEHLCSMRRFKAAFSDSGETAEIDSQIKQDNHIFPSSSSQTDVFN